MSTTDLLEFENVGAWDGVYRVAECRRALSPSGLPGIDHALNPYGGCEHGCIYCYAPEVTHADWDGWRVVRVRSNIAARLAAELPGLTGTVGIGTVTDPYHKVLGNASGNLWTGSIAWRKQRRNISGTTWFESPRVRGV